MSMQHIVDHLSKDYNIVRMNQQFDCEQLLQQFRHLCCKRIYQVEQLLLEGFGLHWQLLFWEHLMMLTYSEFGQRSI
jgi:hypothetical protein